MAAGFDTATDRVDFPAGGDAPPNPAAGFTFAGWFQLLTDRNDFSALLRMWRDGGATTALNLATDNDGTTPNVFTIGQSFTGPAPLVLGAWRWLAVTVAGTDATMYVGQEEGVLLTASGTLNTNVVPAGFTIGGRGPGDDTEWAAVAAERVRLWASVLTPIELLAERSAPDVLHTQDLWSEYPMLTGGDLLDTSGNGRHLVAGSTPTQTVAPGPVFPEEPDPEPEPEPEPDPAPPMLLLEPNNRGWYQLLAIGREAAALAEEEINRAPTACPNDGEPLRSGPNGVLYCPYDGWRPAV